MIEVKNLTHIYAHSVTGIKNINISIGSGEVVAIIGISGAGKSTLLRCINRLLEPTSGSIIIDGEDILHSKQQTQLIRRKIGMIFQNFNLLQRSLVIQNVLLGRLGYISTIRSFLYNYAFSEHDKQIALGCLRRVGIEDLAYRRADTLSGGQQQRVGIARALAQNPSIMLADEPISNLDPVRKSEIMNLLRDIYKTGKLTTVLSLHDIDVAKEYADRIIGIVKGEIVFDGNSGQLSEEKILEIFA